MATLIRLATELSDPYILLEITFQLRRPPLETSKFLFERRRRELAHEAYAGLKKIMRAKVQTVDRV